MTIPLPNLDDRTFTDLVEEMRALIPRYASTWTDHNPSDPGITLLELFAWLTEALIYRLNRIPAASEARLLKLLGATIASTDPTGLDDARAQAIGALKTRWRAITAEDFEALVLGEEGFKLVRAKCLPEYDLDQTAARSRYEDRPGHVSVIVVPKSEQDRPKPSRRLRELVWKFLDERRLLTCRHHVVAPTYTDVRVEAEVVLLSQISQRGEVENRIIANLKEFFHPWRAGPHPEQNGWPFGRSVYASEVSRVIQNTESVDHVEALTLKTRKKRGKWKTPDDPERIDIDPDNLIHFDDQSSSIRAKGSS